MDRHLPNWRESLDYLNAAPLAHESWGYSSHQFSVCVETEISSINDVAGESSPLGS